MTDVMSLTLRFSPTHHLSEYLFVQIYHGSSLLGPGPSLISPQKRSVMIGLPYLPQGFHPQVMDAVPKILIPSKEWLPQITSPLRI